MTTRRWVLMPVAAVALVTAVIGVQLANGGGSFEPMTPADPCAERSLVSAAGGIEGLTEQLVLRGVDHAACTLGVTREQLILRIARSDGLSDAQIAALRDGLLAGVDEMDAQGLLPPASRLVDEALATADLNAFLETVIRAVPDSLVDRALQTDDVLTRAIDGLDLRELLADLDSRDDLEQQVTDAVTQAVKDALVDRLRQLI